MKGVIEPHIGVRWANVVSAATRCIGKEDADAWLASIADILADPYFVRDPVPYEWAADSIASVKYPHVVGHTWVSPHPNMRAKLGYYQIWRQNCRVQEVFGSEAVRLALLENNFVKAKL